MKLKFKFNLKRELKITAALAVVVALIAFTERKQGELAIKDVSIKIENTEENHFVDEADVMDLMDVNLESLKGAELRAVDLKDIEKKIKSEPFIEDADIYSDLKGNVVVKAELRRPIARMVR